jgi:DNA-binding HxlR family transcriptional regulator
MRTHYAARMDFGAWHCSVARTLDVVGETWTPLLVRDLHLGVDRFDDLVRDLGISRALLARRLAHLVAHGVVEREAYQQRPVRHRYRLTAAGRALVPVVMAMMAWGDRFATPPGGPPMRLHHETCGADFTPTVCCSACGEPIDPDAVRASPGPGATPGPGTRVLAERFARADAPGATSGNDQDEHSG